MSSGASPEVKRLAALVFEDSDAANRIVEDFARELLRSGRRVAGMIQLADSSLACDCRDTLIFDVETGETHSILQDLGRHSQACRVDTSAIAHAAHLIGAAIERAPELLFINRFGKLEMEGKGLYAEIGAAVAADIPTLVGVGARYAEHWRAFAMGLDVELPCSAEALRQWWSCIAKPGEVAEDGAEARPPLRAAG